MQIKRLAGNLFADLPDKPILPMIPGPGKAVLDVDQIRQIIGWEDRDDVEVSGCASNDPECYHEVAVAPMTHMKDRCVVAPIMYLPTPDYDISHQGPIYQSYFNLLFDSRGTARYENLIHADHLSKELNRFRDNRYILSSFNARAINDRYSLGKLENDEWYLERWFSYISLFSDGQFLDDKLRILNQLIQEAVMYGGAVNFEPDQKLDRPASESRAVEHLESVLDLVPTPEAAAQYPSNAALFRAASEGQDLRDGAEAIRKGLTRLFEARWGKKPPSTPHGFYRLRKERESNAQGTGQDTEA